MNEKNIGGLMADNLCYRILRSHLVSGKLEKGETISIRIDQTLTQDATGTMAYLEFESMDIDRVRNELAVSYVDHNTVQVGFENFDDHEYLRTVAAKKGVVYSRAGNGICHQLQLENFACPGKTLLGSDSHTPTQGGIGEIAIGSGGLDVALAMAGHPFSLIAPKVVGIELKGKLRNGVSAKDIILKVLEKYGVKGNVNSVFEYYGEGVSTLTVPERATICNMGAEAGVTFSIFPSDEETEKFLAAHDRQDSYVPLCAEDGASYDETWTVDLSTLSAMIAMPHSPGNVARVKDIEGLKVDQILIGSCTNSSYMDLVKVARILKGHVVHPTVSLGIAPGSREVLEMISQDGTLASLVASGARILECACGFCIGNHQSPGTDGVSLRTSNRNFEGRSGTKSGRLYLCSPETAAISAISGFLTDPEGKMPFDSIDLPEHYAVDRSMFIFPPENSSSVVVKRGPNIGEPPKNVPLKDDIPAVVAIKVGDKITTDHIMPAGARLKYRSNIREYSKYVFEGVDPTFSARTLENRDKGIGSVIVAGYSYGQGSSREHAAICPMYLGVKAIVAKSIERIHQANLCNFGIIPLVFTDERDYDRIGLGDRLSFFDLRRQVADGTVVLVNETKNESYRLDVYATEEQKEMLLAGGRLNLVR